jgi:ABC-type transport system involved in multi-copper enzyme maturation permease subunit
MSTSATVDQLGDHFGLSDVVRSEWTKFVSLRSSRWTLVGFALIGVGLGILISALTGAHWPHTSAETRADWDPTNNTLAGLIPGYLVIPVLGVLMMTSEYSSGSIRSTFAAVPKRVMVLAAKSIVFAGAALVVVEAATFVTFLAGQRVMGTAPHASLGQPGVLRALILSGAFLVLMGLFGLGLATIIRRSGAAVAVYAGVAVVLPNLLGALPGNLWRFGPITILANSEGAVKILPGALSPWTGFAVMTVYAAVALAVGAVLLVRRDA